MSQSHSVVSSRKFCKTPNSSPCTSRCLSPSRTLQRGKFSGEKVSETHFKVFPKSYFHRELGGLGDLFKDCFLPPRASGKGLEPHTWRCPWRVPSRCPTVSRTCSVLIEGTVPLSSLVTAPTASRWSYSLKPRHFTWRIFSRK